MMCEHDDEYRRNMQRTVSGYLPQIKDTRNAGFLRLTFSVRASQLHHKKSGFFKRSYKIIKNPAWLNLGPRVLGILAMGGFNDTVAEALQKNSHTR